MGIERHAARAAFPSKLDLSAHWTLDETTTGSRFDSHGAFTLTNNGSTPGAEGKIHNGADLTRSSSQWLSRADHASLSSGDADWTISAWVRLDSEPVGGTMTVVSKSTGTASTSEYSVQYTQSTDKFSVSIMKSGVTTTVTATEFGNVTTGTWYHIVAWHANGSQLGIAINGVANVGTYTTGANDTTEDFRIGANGGGTPNYFDGMIDEVSFWKRALTPVERYELYNSTLTPNTGRGAWFPGLVGFFEGQNKDATTMDRNAVSLRNWAASNGGWYTRESLELEGSLYYFDETITWPARTGLPVVRGGGGEPIWHPESQYWATPIDSRGGAITAMVWAGADKTTSMWDILGYGFTIDGVHFMGKQDTTDDGLLKDDTTPTKLDYPYANPLETHAGEDRCRYAIRVQSESNTFGNGKGIFPRGLATHLFQVGILADDDPDVVPNHNDQCHVLGRFMPAYCDVGFWSKQRQAFSWHFDQIESASRWTILLDAGGKLFIDQLDLGLNCAIGLFVRGSDAAQGTGPDETIINYINIDEKAPNDCVLVRIDSNHAGTLTTRTDADTGVITTPVIHSVKAGETLNQVSWSGGARYSVNVTSVTDTTISFDGGSGNDLTTLNSPVTAVRYSSTSTIIGAAHVPNARASKGRGERVYRVTDADFSAGNTILGLADSNLAVLLQGDWVEFYDEDEPYPYFPKFVTKIHTWDDTFDTITITGGNFFGSLPPNSNDRWTIVVWRPSRERPLFSFKNTYGLHRINNLRLGYGRMVRAQGGTATFPVRTVFDGVLFCGRSRDPLNVEMGASWLYGGPYESDNVTTSPEAKAIAMLYTTDSIGFVEGQLTKAYEEPSALKHGGERYENFSWRGELNGAGAFSSVDIDVW